MARHLGPRGPAHTLDNLLLGILHRPEKILKGYLGPGATALDLGCGLGHFSLGMARLVEAEGKVVAVDWRQNALSALERRARRAGLLERLEFRLCSREDLGLADLAGRLDFGLCFYSLHQVEDKQAFLAQARQALRPGAGFLMAEPSFRVKREVFVRQRAEMLRAGFVELKAPKIGFSHAALYSR